MASYAQSSNANLVATYGFIQPNNTHDVILVPAALVDRLSSGVHARRALKRAL